MSLERQVKIAAYSEISNLSPSGYAEGEAEITEEGANGTLSLSDGELVLKYEVKTENGCVATEITLGGDGMRVKRCGEVSSDFLFKEGFEHKSLYSVGPYSFDTVIRTRKIRANLTETGGRVDVYYDMKIGGADKYVKMKITAE